MICQKCESKNICNNGRVGEPPLCPSCWIQARQVLNPDVRYFLAVVERVLPNPLPGAAVHHTVGDLLKAVPLVKTVPDMRRFHRGYAGWLDYPGHPPGEAERQAAVNLGALVAAARLSWWRRLRWRWACGVVPGEDFFG